ncbi:hypothetical protein FDA94_21800 [Herbidospora galbida]|uniref:Uncharacterized protein n=1 Tax=Herbidospora galbida TaxID=2575442 RepID=A0A4U3MDI1_9ACTN|nr:hypothetical protein [Herbidospora galbida]TKK86452.1 hypothetical protein FDA94_21800 [Herbidospora galbida]
MKSPTDHRDPNQAADQRDHEHAHKPTTPGQHRWTHHDNYHATCRRCGTRAQKRPSPYGRRWWTEWRLPDGTTRDNYNGQPTPPCQPTEEDTGAC